MKIEIEVYKGQTIFYDEDADKFICDISVEDSFKKSKRGSLKDIRKEIDVFIKLNVDFKPFKAFKKSSYGEDFTLVEIVAIRSDGKLVEKNNYGNKSYLDKKEIQSLMVYVPSIQKELEDAEEKVTAARNELAAVRKRLSETLVPVNLSKYEHIINQE